MFSLPGLIFSILLCPVVFGADLLVGAENKLYSNTVVTDVDRANDLGVMVSQPDCTIGDNDGGSDENSSSYDRDSESLYDSGSSWSSYSYRD